jgi:hypothetical protein
MERLLYLRQTGYPHIRTPPPRHTPHNEQVVRGVGQSWVWDVHSGGWTGAEATGYASASGSLTPRAIYQQSVTASQRPTEPLQWWGPLMESRRSLPTE